MTAPTLDAPEAASTEPRRPRRRRWVRVAIVVLVIVAVAAAAWAVWLSPLLAARQVRVVGVEGVRAGAVLAAAALPVGVPLARIDTAPAERAVAAMPWVAGVEVRRGWPAELVVAVTPREPVAVVEGAQARTAVDATGTTFEVTGALPKGLPRVRAEGDALREAMAVLTSLAPDLARRVVSVAATTRDDVTLTLRSGDLVRWGSSDQAAFKAEVLRALMGRKAQVYDVSAPELPTTFRPAS